VLHFNTSPVEIVGGGRVEGLTVARNRLEPDGRGGVRAVPTDETHTLPVGLVFRSVGYRGVPLAGVPFDERRGVVPNVSGRVVDEAGSTTPVPGLYVAGWIKRGPQGVIGTNKQCAGDTVTQLLADAEAGTLPAVQDDLTSIDELLAERGVRVTTWSDWQALDRAEQERGAQAGRPRAKICAVDEMLEILETARVNAG
jgi:ferredoxin--NADP+ reductase